MMQYGERVQGWEGRWSDSEQEEEEEEILACNVCARDGCCLVRHVYTSYVHARGLACAFLC
jgi:hypothetical protein